MATVLNDVGALTRFSTFLGQAAPTVTALAGIDRPLLERYLAWLATQPVGLGAKEDAVTGVHLFLSAIRQHGWDDTLPTTAVFFAGDTPRRPPRRSRRLSEHVMAQIEAPANLDRGAPRRPADHPDPDPVRVARLRRLHADLRLPAPRRPGRPYLRYVNHKMRREAAVPIDDELEAEIRAQQTGSPPAGPTPTPACSPGTAAAPPGPAR